jgi:hypothetical protein
MLSMLSQNRIYRENKNNDFCFTFDLSFYQQVFSDGTTTRVHVPHVCMYVCEASLVFMYHTVRMLLQ